MKMYIESGAGKYLLQQYDVFLLMALNVKMPLELIEELNEQVDSSYDPNGPRCCHFDLVIENPVSMEWLDENECILDYTQFVNRSVPDVINYCHTLSEALKILEKGAGTPDLGIVRALTYRIESLDYFLECRNGGLEEKVPYYQSLS